MVRATILPDPSKQSAGGEASQTTNTSAGKSPGVQADQTQQQQKQARNPATGQMNQKQQAQGNQAQQQQASGQKMNQQQQAQANQAQQQNVGVDGNPVAPNANNGEGDENKRPPHFVKVDNQVEA